MSDIYLGRLLTLEGAEKFEDALQGYKGQIGPNVKLDEIGLSTVDIEPNFEKYKSDTARYVINKNMEGTRAIHSFCMVGSDLSEVMTNLKICAFQPTSEEAIANIENHKALAQDYFGRDRVAVLVIKMPEELFKTYCETGLAGYGAESGKYEFNGSTELLAEAIVGDRVLQDAIKEKQVILYDEVHKAFDAAGMDYDNGVFDNYYRPTKTIGMKKENKKSKMSSELEEALEEIMARTDLSPEEKKLMLEAYQEAADYANGR